MGLYEIYIPELDTIVKFKILSLEEGQIFCLDHEGDSTEAFKQAVLENIIYNLKTDVTKELRKQPKEQGEAILDLLYNASIALNPGMNLATWIRLARSDRVFAGFPAASASSSTTKESTKRPLRKRDGHTIARSKFLNLERHLSEKVVGQDEAIADIVSSLKRAHVGLKDPNRPLAVLMFAGASGVGKTHLAEELHRYLFGDKYGIIRVDCGEYQQKQDNQKLIGSPPGYIGSDQGGQLTNQVMAHPDSVILIDEMEKAEFDIFNTFLRVFDEGLLTDGQGRVANFRNTIIICTTNLGNEEIVRDMIGKKVGFGVKLYTSVHDAKLIPREAIVSHTEQEIRDKFRPEVLNRIDKIVIFNHLTDPDYRKIAELELQVVQDKLSSQGFSMEYDNDVIEEMLLQGVNPVEGARHLARVRRSLVEDPLADLLLDRNYPRGSVFQLLPGIAGFRIIAQVPRRAKKEPKPKEEINELFG
jgi:ATP-dependent Clp protease ATP-binding subunit ClpA